MKRFGKITLLVSALAFTSCAFSEEGKQDIKGFTTGISFAEAGQIAKDRHYSCVNFSREVIPYGIKCEDFTLWFSTVLDSAPLMGVFTTLQTTSTIEEIVQSLSAQFSKQAIELKPDGRLIVGYVWDFGNGKILRFIPNARSVELYDNGLMDRDEAERFRRSRVPVPKL